MVSSSPALASVISISISSYRVLNRGQKLDELGRGDGAHDAELEPDLLQLGEFLGAPFGGMRLVIDLLKVRVDRTPEVGQVGIRALAMK